jgi:hypothetical protein
MPYPTRRSSSSNDTPQSLLQRFLSLPDEPAQYLVDERLVIPAACLIHSLAKPVQNVIVQPDRARVFPGGTVRTGPRLPLLKSYSFFILRVFQRSHGIGEANIARWRGRDTSQPVNMDSRVVA